jgi:tumor protein p53-inducible protein 3
MRAVIATQAGGPEVLSIVEVPSPEAQATELLVEVHTSALNRADLLQRRGVYPPPPGCSQILGLECAGVVRAVGPETSKEWLGRSVMALLGSGGYAEQVTIPERMAIPLWPGLSFEDAAAIPEAFLTAHEALHEEAQLGPLETVLIHAGASGVGSAAVQLARAHGARVFATAGSAEKCRWVEALGAEVCFDYKSESFAEALEQRLGARAIDVVIDFVGAAFFEQNVRVLKNRGRLVSLGVLGGSKASIELGAVLSRRLRILGLVMRSRSVQEKIELTQRFLRRGLPLLQAGTVRPTVDRIFPLAEVHKAHEWMEQNLNRGKIVLRVRD